MTTINQPRTEQFSEAEVEAANDHNKMLIDRIRGMPAQPGGLSEEIGWLLEEIEEQKAEIDRLRADNENLQKAWHDAECGRDRLRAEVAELRKVLANLLKLPVAIGALKLLNRGIGTATPNKIWLEANAILAKTQKEGE